MLEASEFVLVQFKIGRLDSFVSGILGEIGYRLVQIKIKRIDTKKVVQIMFERLDDKGVTIADCEKATRALSKKMDDGNYVCGAYNLELSSCGIDRPLVVREDFIRFCGHYVKVRLHKSVGGMMNVDGLLLSSDDDGITVEYEAIADMSTLCDNLHVRRRKNKSNVLKCKSEPNNKGCFVKTIVNIKYSDIRNANIDGWKCLHSNVAISSM